MDIQLTSLFNHSPMLLSFCMSTIVALQPAEIRLVKQSRERKRR